MAKRGLRLTSRREEDQILWSLAVKAKKLGIIKTVPRALLQSREKLSSKKGKMGRIVVNVAGNIVDNSASHFVSKFSRGLGGREEVMAALVAIEEKLSPTNKRVLDTLRAHPNAQLAFCIAKAKAEPVHVVKQVIEGQMALGKAEALAELARNQGSLMRDLLRHALDKEEKCLVCLGYGKVPFDPKAKFDPDKENNLPCTACGGSGATMASSKHKEWAMKKALEVAELGPASEKGVQVNVQTAIGVKVEGASTRLAQLAKVSDEILFASKQQASLPASVPVASLEAPDTIEAEVISNG